jgi:hypothetical protein
MKETYKMCGEREWRLSGEDKAEYGAAAARINVSYIQDVWSVLEGISNKVVPEIPFVGLLKLKAPAHTISVESTLALNPWHFGAKVVYVHTPGTHPPHCKAIYDSLSVLLKLEKSQESQSNTLHMANYCPNFIAYKALAWVGYKLGRWDSKSLWNKVL